MAWYDGYELNGVSICDPKSIVETALTKEFAGHWSGTSSYLPIYDYISLNINGLKSDVEKMVAGTAIKANTSKYMNTAISTLRTISSRFSRISDTLPTTKRANDTSVQ